MPKLRPHELEVEEGPDTTPKPESPDSRRLQRFLGVQLVAISDFMSLRRPETQAMSPLVLLGMAAAKEQRTPEFYLEQKLEVPAVK